MFHLAIAKQLGCSFLGYTPSSSSLSIHNWIVIRTTCSWWCFIFYWICLQLLAVECSLWIELIQFDWETGYIIAVGSTNECIVQSVVQMQWTFKYITCNWKEMAKQNEEKKKTSNTSNWNHVEPNVCTISWCCIACTMNRSLEMLLMRPVVAAALMQIYLEQPLDIGFASRNAAKATTSIACIEFFQFNCKMILFIPISNRNQIFQRYFFKTFKKWSNSIASNIGSKMLVFGSAIFNSTSLWLNLCN